MAFWAYAPNMDITRFDLYFLGKQTFQKGSGSNFFLRTEMYSSIDNRKVFLFFSLHLTAFSSRAFNNCINRFAAFPRFYYIVVYCFEIFVIVRTVVTPRVGYFSSATSAEQDAETLLLTEYIVKAFGFINDANGITIK